ncbi:MAG: hypothetical protein J5659_03425 [Clostridia bacterium]|nr:hypothetical protein [Clostridia bacterium]
MRFNKACAEDQPGTLVMFHLSCTGTIKIETISGGQPQVTQVTDIEEEYPEGMTADANTDIVITGDLTELSFGPPSLNACEVLDASKNSAFLGAYIGTQDIETLKLPASTTVLQWSQLKSITLIEYPANNEDVSDELSDIIAGADSATGTLYTDPNGAYYVGLKHAADVKGWTTQPIS